MEPNANTALNQSIELFNDFSPRNLMTFEKTIYFDIIKLIR